MRIGEPARTRATAPVEPLLSCRRLLARVTERTSTRANDGFPARSLRRSRWAKPPKTYAAALVSSQSSFRVTEGDYSYSNPYQESGAFFGFYSCAHSACAAGTAGSRGARDRLLATARGRLRSRSFVLAGILRCYLLVPARAAREISMAIVAGFCRWSRASVRPGRAVRVQNLQVVSTRVPEIDPAERTVPPPGRTLAEIARVWPHPSARNPYREPSAYPKSGRASRACAKRRPRHRAFSDPERGLAERYSRCRTVPDGVLRGAARLEGSRIGRASAKGIAGAGLRRGGALRV